MAKERMPRVEELIKRELISILTKDLCLPGVGFITITRVHITKDLKHAEVFVSVFGDEKKQEETINILNSQGKNIYQILKPRIRIKYIPSFSFILDHSAAYSDHISRKLMDIKRIDSEDKDKD